MTPISTLLAGITVQDGTLTAAIGDDWRQGRTVYGGLSAALCIEAAMRQWPDLPPFRSAQFGFVGPAAGAAVLRPHLLRRGKSVVFINVDLDGENGLATRALLCFAAPRASQLHHSDLAAPAVPPPDQCPNFFAAARPAFTQHFDMRQAGGALPASASPAPAFLLWIRHRDTAATMNAVSLVALADAAPPAAMAMFTQPAPISTMTWSVEMLGAGIPSAASDWLLMRSAAQTVSGGYSSQAMTVWDEAGRPVMAGSQCVAVFA